MTGHQPTFAWLGKLFYSRCGIVEVSYLIQEDGSNSQWNICSHSVDLITVYYDGLVESHFRHDASV